MYYWIDVLVLLHNKCSVPACLPPCSAFVNVVVLVTTTFATIETPDMRPVIGRRTHAAVLLCLRLFHIHTDPSLWTAAVLHTLLCSPPFTSNTANLLVLFTTNEPFVGILLELDWSNGEWAGGPSFLRVCCSE